LSRARRSPERSSEPHSLGMVLDALGVERRLAVGLSLGNLARRWVSVVGERLAEESAPAGLEGGVLLVRASSAAWAAQISFLSKQIAAEANRLLEPAQGGDLASDGRVSERLIRDVRVVVETGPPTP
jgi:predicted nucleic acid-binding Zn ribbon protein